MCGLGCVGGIWCLAKTRVAGSNPVSHSSFHLLEGRLGIRSGKILRRLELEMISPLFLSAVHRLIRSLRQQVRVIPVMGG